MEKQWVPLSAATPEIWLRKAEGFPSRDVPFAVCMTKQLNVARMGAFQKDQPAYAQGLLPLMGEQFGQTVWVNSLSSVQRACMGVLLLVLGSQPRMNAWCQVGPVPPRGGTHGPVMGPGFCPQGRTHGSCPELGRGRGTLARAVGNGLHVEGWKHHAGENLVAA